MKNYKEYGDCPVCKENCNLEEDIVVCPECGAPYHRDCYNSLGECVFKEKHSQGFSYNKSKSDNDEAINENLQTTSSKINSTDEKKCPHCFKENSVESFFCSNCGCPLLPNKNNSEILTNIPISSQFDQFMNMAKDDIINNIKVSEFVYYIKVNFMYYVACFKNIFEKNKSRFNFGAFLFSGAWFLYRKIYKIGIPLTLVYILLSIFSFFIEFTYANEILTSVFHAIGISTMAELFNKTDAFLNHFYTLPVEQQFIVFLPAIVKLIKFVIMLVSGFIANKVYYKNCCSKIKKIKVLCKDDNKLYNEEINKLGGVNFKIITFIFICYLIIEYLPNFLI